MNALSGAMQYPRGTESWAAAHAENSSHWKIHTSYSPHILEMYAINELQIGNVHCVQEQSKPKCFRHLPQTYADADKIWWTICGKFRKCHKVVYRYCLGKVENIYAKSWEIYSRYYMPNFIRISQISKTI